MRIKTRVSSLFEQVRKDLDFSQFLSGLRENGIAYYIYYLSTGNVKGITTADGIISMQSDRPLLRVSSATDITLIRKAGVKYFSGITTFEKYCYELACAGVFKWVADVEENKRCYWSTANILLHEEKIHPGKPATSRARNIPVRTSCPKMSSSPECRKQEFAIIPE